MVDCQDGERTLEQQFRDCRLANLGEQERIKRGGYPTQINSETAVYATQASITPEREKPYFVRRAGL